MNIMQAEEYIDRNLSSKTRTVKKIRCRKKMAVLHHIRTKIGNTLNYQGKSYLSACNVE